MKKISIIIFLCLIFGNNIYSQSIDGILNKMKENYRHDSFNTDDFNIVLQYKLPGYFRANMSLDENTKSDDFYIPFSYDTVHTIKSGTRYISYYKKSSSIPETFGDEIDVYFRHIPDPVSGDLYDTHSYELLSEICTPVGTAEFEGRQVLKLKVNVNKLGFLIKQRELFNRNFFKDISIYLDNKTYLITGYSFEMILNPKSHINMKHHIVLEDYRNKNGVLLPTKIKRLNYDFVNSAVHPDIRGEFFDRIDDNIDLINQLKKECANVNDELRDECNEYWKNAMNEYFLLKQMTTKDVFELEYKVINVF